MQRFPPKPPSAIMLFMTLRHQNPAYREPEGFIALITAIILTVILLTLTISINSLGYFTRSEILGAEFKERSSALAEACADRAIQNLIADPDYAGGETVTVGSDECSIDSVTPSGSTATIQTSAAYPSGSNGAATTLEIEVETEVFSIESWREVP